MKRVMTLVAALLLATLTSLTAAGPARPNIFKSEQGEKKAGAAQKNDVEVWRLSSESTATPKKKAKAAN